MAGGSAFDAAAFDAALEENARYRQGLLGQANAKLEAQRRERESYFDPINVTRRQMQARRQNQRVFGMGAGGSHVDAMTPEQFDDYTAGQIGAMAQNQASTAQYGVRGGNGPTARESYTSTVGPLVRGSVAQHNPATGISSYVRPGPVDDPVGRQRFIEGLSTEAVPSPGHPVPTSPRLLPNGEVSGSSYAFVTPEGTVRIVGRDRVGYGPDGTTQIMPRTDEQRQAHQQQIQQQIERRKRSLMEQMAARGISVPAGVTSTSGLQQAFRMGSRTRGGGILSGANARSSGSSGIQTSAPDALRSNLLRNEITNEAYTRTGLVDDKGQPKAPSTLAEYNQVNQSTVRSLHDRIRSGEISEEEAYRLAREADANNPTGVISVEEHLRKNVTLENERRERQAKQDNEMMSTPPNPLLMGPGRPY